MNGHYGVVAFVFGNTFSSMPFLLLISLISSSICYFMVGFHPGFVHFLYFELCLYACVLVVEGMMMAIASVVPNFLMGIITGAGIQVSYLLFFSFIYDLRKFRDDENSRVKGLNIKKFEGLRVFRVLFQLLEF